ncbi:MAG: hypothetical protein HQ553_08560 [Chloroflexi bacterium]|nr:hypothetical protein [Chloroflexota bacterium]
MKVKESVIGVLAFLPLLLLILVIALALMIPVDSFGELDKESREYRALEVLSPVYYVVAVLLLSLIFNFILYGIFKRDRVPEDKRILWAVLLVILNIFVLPVFWYHYIWKDPQE